MESQALVKCGSIEKKKKKQQKKKKVKQQRVIEKKKKKQQKKKKKEKQQRASREQQTGTTNVDAPRSHPRTFKDDADLRPPFMRTRVSNPTFVEIVKRKHLEHAGRALEFYEKSHQDEPEFEILQVVSIGSSELKLPESDEIKFWPRDDLGFNHGCVFCRPEQVHPADGYLVGRPPWYRPKVRFGPRYASSRKW
ncbi:hypothetical protein M5689_002470 [Euphorbia peplus]|nr:hypothetical protein M5689_002470 [Euphorbia peplus]